MGCVWVQLGTSMKQTRGRTCMLVRNLKRAMGDEKAVEKAEDQGRVGDHRCA